MTLIRTPYDDLVDILVDYHNYRFFVGQTHVAEVVEEDGVFGGQINGLDFVLGRQKKNSIIHDHAIEGTLPITITHYDSGPSKLLVGRVEQRRIFSISDDVTSLLALAKDCNSYEDLEIFSSWKDELYAESERYFSGEKKEIKLKGKLLKRLEGSDKDIWPRVEFNEKYNSLFDEMTISPSSDVHVSAVQKMFTDYSRDSLKGRYRLNLSYAQENVENTLVGLHNGSILGFLIYRIQDEEGEDERFVNVRAIGFDSQYDPSTLGQEFLVRAVNGYFKDKVLYVDIKDRKSQYFSRLGFVHADNPIFMTFGQNIQH